MKSLLPLATSLFLLDDKMYIAIMIVEAFQERLRALAEFLCTIFVFLLSFTFFRITFTRRYALPPRSCKTFVIAPSSACRVSVNSVTRVVAGILVGMERYRWWWWRRHLCFCAWSTSVENDKTAWFVTESDVHVQKRFADMIGKRGLFQRRKRNQKRLSDLGLLPNSE